MKQVEELVLLVTIGSNNSYFIDEDEMQLLRPFLAKISEAVRAAR